MATTLPLLSNEKFGDIIGPLITPMYVLQMARSKRWGRQAQIENLHKFVLACEESKQRANEEIKLLILRDEKE